MSLTVLGIETSCDETAAAVYNTQRGVLSSRLFSQVDLQAHYGGVVPEISSRHQLEKIGPIVQDALRAADVSLKEIDVIAVTYKPGLPGSLLVGLCYAKGLAWAAQKKLVGVNHLEGHAFSSFLEQRVPFPHLCLTVSGGHTSLYIVHDFGMYEVIGHTRDDAAGEAFDKVAKLMNLPYPGGPVIEKLAQQVDFKDFFSYPRSMHNAFDMSFSGLKTAVMYDLVARGAYDMQSKKFTQDDNILLKQQVASSFLVCVKDIFVQRIVRALAQFPDLQAVTFVGGVACNRYLKQELAAVCTAQKIRFFSPSPQYCTDNAAMIAFVGAYKAQRGQFAELTLDIF